MKKIKLYYTYLYQNMINDEEWGDVTWIGKIAIFFPWLIRSILILVLSPIGFPIYLLCNSKLYFILEEKAILFYLDIMKDYQEFVHEMEQQGKKNV